MAGTLHKYRYSFFNYLSLISYYNKKYFRQTL